MKKLALSILVATSLVCSGVAMAHHQGHPRGTPPMMRDFAPVPPAGHDRGITNILFKFDEDQDGALSKAELEKYKSEGLKYTKELEEATVQFDKADLNHDGFISFDEYLQLPKVERFKILGFDKPHHKAHAKPPKNDQKHKKHEKDQKLAKDQKKDQGKKDQFKEHKLDPKFTVHQSFKRFAFFDQDYDGKLSIDEYNELLKLRAENIKAMKEALNEIDFDKIDLNQDQIASPFELHHFIGSLILSRSPKYEPEQLDAAEDQEEE